VAVLSGSYAFWIQMQLTRMDAHWLVCLCCVPRCPLQRVLTGAQGPGGVRDQADRQVPLELTADHWGGEQGGPACTSRGVGGQADSCQFPQYL
jgi:hypothetical protein